MHRHGRKNEGMGVKWKPFKEKTVEEQLAEMFSLGVYKRKTPKKVKKRGAPKGRRTNNISHPQQYDRTDPSADHVCESIPLEHEVSSLHAYTPPSVRAEINTSGYGMAKAAKQGRTKCAMKGKNLNLAEDMFTITDIHEFTCAGHTTITKIMAALGYLKRLPGRYIYAPLNREQAKNVMHHLYLDRAGFSRK